MVYKFKSARINSNQRAFVQGVFCRVYRFISTHACCIESSHDAMFSWTSLAGVPSWLCLKGYSWLGCFMGSHLFASWLVCPMRSTFTKCWTAYTVDRFSTRCKRIYDLLASFLGRLRTTDLVDSCLPFCLLHYVDSSVARVFPSCIFPEGPGDPVGLRQATKTSLTGGANVPLL